LRRLERKGFLQKRIYHLFGYYPWECPKCRGVVLLKKRHQRKRSHSHESATTSG
jgi:DNA-directed RNA polymerase subunit RPC12/RpoP